MQTNQIYVLAERSLPVGGDLTVRDQAGRSLFGIDASAYPARKTLVLCDERAQPLYEIAATQIGLQAMSEIRRPGQVLATIQRAVVSPVTARYSVTLSDGRALQVVGRVGDHEFQVTEFGQMWIQASRQSAVVRQTYGVWIAPGVDVPLGLALVIAIDQMELEHRQRVHNNLRHDRMDF